MPYIGEFAQPLSAGVIAFSKALGAMGIPTIWAMWPQLEIYSEQPRAILSVAEQINLLDHEQRGIEDIPLCDWSVLQGDRNAFRNQNLAPEIARKLQAKTVLTTGILRGECLDETILGGLRTSDLNFVAVADLISPQLIMQDCLTHEKQRITKWPIGLGNYDDLLANNHAYFSDFAKTNTIQPERFGFATSGQILNRLAHPTKSCYVSSDRQKPISDTFFPTYALG